MTLYKIKTGFQTFPDVFLSEVVILVQFIKFTNINNS